MTIESFNNGESLASVRTKINANAAELDTRVSTAQTAATSAATAASAAASAAAAAQTTANAKYTLPVTGIPASDLASAVQTALSDAREWTAATVGQAEAEAGTATTRRAWTAERVRQAIAAWWASATTTVGRALATAADEAAGRVAIDAQRAGYVGGVAVTGTPTAGQTLLTTSDTAATWQTPSGGLPSGVTYASNVFQIGAGTNAQALRVTNTTDGTNSEFGVLKWSSNVLQIGTEAAGTGVARSLSLVVGGSAGLTIDSFQNLFIGNGKAIRNTGGVFYIDTDLSTGDDIVFRTRIDEKLRVVNSSGVLAFGGGKTSAYPGLKRSAATLQVRLADDSGAAALSASYLKTSGYTVATLPLATVGAGARAQVSDSNSTTFGAIVAGGGSSAVTVYSDGTNWRIG